MDPAKDIVRKVKETIFRYQMVDPGDLCILGVSGGPDSVCLLHILHELRGELEIRLVVAHYDHGLREKEDEAETRFVRRLASSLALPFESEKASLLKEGITSSVEERARNARYAFFESLKDKLCAQKIALGHNLNDQAETVLMRLLRGSGPSGLAGIPPSRENTIIRPLIEIRREEIESYLKSRELTYVIDSSNLQTDYLRNKIRLELLPRLLEYQPRLIDHLGQLASIIWGDNKYLETPAPLAASARYKHAPEKRLLQKRWKNKECKGQQRRQPGRSQPRRKKARPPADKRCGRNKKHHRQKRPNPLPKRGSAQPRYQIFLQI